MNTLMLWPSMLAGTATDYIYGLLLFPIIRGIVGNHAVTNTVIANAAFMTKIAATKTSYFQGGIYGYGANLFGGISSAEPVTAGDGYSG